jgi:dTMP kinase
VYIAYPRDIVRGSSSTWVRKVYDFAIKPDATFYFRAPDDIAIERISVGGLNTNTMKQGWIWI